MDKRDVLKEALTTTFVYGVGGFILLLLAGEEVGEEKTKDTQQKNKNSCSDSLEDIKF
jgi:hypothetical protein